MATPRGRASTPPLSQTNRLKGTNSKATTKYSFRIQSVPPLSIQQSLRSSSGKLPGAKEWQVSGRYRPPPFHAYVPPTLPRKKKPVEPVWHPSGSYREKPPTSLSPERIERKHTPEPVWHPPSPYREKPPTSLSPERIERKHTPEPVWHPPSPYREKPPTSLSPERIERKRTPEPVWHPSGRTKHENVSYFDPPSLRWSLQELLRSMPELRPQTFRSSTSRSTIKKSEETEDT